MKEVATKKQTKKQIILTGIVSGFIIAFVLIVLSFFIPFLGIPLLILFLVVWPIAVIMRLCGIMNIHIFGNKFIEKE